MRTRLEDLSRSEMWRGNQGLPSSASATSDHRTITLSINQRLNLSINQSINHLFCSIVKQVSAVKVYGSVSIVRRFDNPKVRPLTHASTPQLQHSRVKVTELSPWTPRTVVCSHRSVATSQTSSWVVHVYKAVTIAVYNVSIKSLLRIAQWIN